MISIFFNSYFKCKPTSLEVDIFPRMVDDGQLFCIEIEGMLSINIFIAGTVTRVHCLFLYTFQGFGWI